LQIENWKLQIGNCKFYFSNFHFSIISWEMGRADNKFIFF